MRLAVSPAFALPLAVGRATLVSDVATRRDNYAHERAATLCSHRPTNLSKLLLEKLLVVPQKL